MDYPQSLAYLNSFYDLEKTMTLPASRRWKLERMRHLLEIFGQPQKSFFPIVIVGTKGKGSTGFFLQSILKEAGVQVGFYSSPHLESPRERIRMNGEMISKKLWSQLLTRIKKELAPSSCLPPQEGGGMKPVSFSLKEKVRMRGELGSFTYFEIMTLMAALAFKEAGVTTAVFEAGMGGRLDAVNALGASIVIVTPIHLDHQEFLGKTLAKIAAEKAAVIHPGAEVIVAPQKPEAMRVIHRRVRQTHARLWPVTQKIKFPVGLLGEHQKWNAAVAVKTAEVLNRLSPFAMQPVDSFSGERGASGFARKNLIKQAIRKGLRSRDWPGRFEVIQTRPSIILDGAHNPAAISALVKTLRQIDGVRVLIFGVTRDKDSQAMLKMLARVFSKVILVSLSSPRGKTTAELFQEARLFFPVQIPAANLAEALRLGKYLAGTTGTLLVTGSFYLIGSIRPLIKKNF